jgi:hypothetical protein
VIARVALAVVMFAAGGAAAEPRAVAILDVEGPSPEVARDYEVGLDARVDRTKVRLMSSAGVHDKLKASTKWTRGCRIGSCLGELRQRTGALLVLEAVLDGSGTSFGYVATLVRTDTGRVVAQASERCDVCTQLEAMASLTAATVKLLASIPDPLPDEAAAQGAAAEVAASSVRREMHASRRGHRRKAIVLAITGLAALGAGVALYAAYDHPRYALAVAGAGGGLALGGVVALTF